MPSFFFTQALTANQVGFNPLQTAPSWQFEIIPAAWMAGAVCKLLTRTTGAAGTVRQSVFSGSTTIMQRSPVQVGGTAGVTPSELNTPAVLWRADPGDRIQIAIDETAGATPTVDGQITVEPL